MAKSWSIGVCHILKPQSVISLIRLFHENEFETPNRMVACRSSFLPFNNQTLVSIDSIEQGFQVRTKLEVLIGHLITLEMYSNYFTSLIFNFLINLE